MGRPDACAAGESAAAISSADGNVGIALTAASVASTPRRGTPIEDKRDRMLDKSASLNSVGLLAAVRDINLGPKAVDLAGGSLITSLDIAISSKGIPADIKFARN
jgi:hypothetical protein